MNRIKKAALAVLAALAISLPLSGCGSNDDFNGWLSGCAAAGGHAALMHAGTWESRYECFKDDAVIVVPGYEGE